MHGRRLSLLSLLLLLHIEFGCAAKKKSPKANLNTKLDPDQVNFKFNPDIAEHVHRTNTPGPDPKKEVCMACHATVNELEKMMKKRGGGRRRTEVELTEDLEHVCETDNFRTYDLIPPKMVNGCKKVLEEFEDNSKVEEALLSGSGDPTRLHEAFRQQVCTKLTKFCRGVAIELEPRNEGLTVVEPAKGGTPAAPKRKTKAKAKAKPQAAPKDET